MVGWSFIGCVGDAVGAAVRAYRGVREATEPCGVYDSGDTIGNIADSAQSTAPASSSSAAASAAASMTVLIEEVLDCLHAHDYESME